MMKNRRGITLVETVLSVLILGGAFVSVLSTVVASRTSHAITAQREMGMVLADDLMAEILLHSQYKEGNTIGPDAGENLGNRSQFDDIDDYDGWAQTPPVDANGNAIAGADAYTREVTVDWVGALLPNDTRTFETGVKKITVTVKVGGRVVAELVANRTDNWQDPSGGY